MKLARLNHIGVVTRQTQFVIASVAKQSSVAWRGTGLPRRFAPRNDGQGRIFVKNPCVYMMAKKRNGVVYTGVTSNLPQRAQQHREGMVEGFTKDNDCKQLVWFEPHATMESAIMREKQIKGGSRVKKLALIEAINPQWKDVYDDIAHG